MSSLPLATLTLLRLFINGQEVSLANAAFHHSGASYLPLREIAPMLGLEVKWDARAKTTRLSRGQRYVVLTAGESAARFGEQAVKLAAPPLLLTPGLYVPAQVLKDGLGFDLRYDGAARAVRILWEDDRTPKAATSADIVRNAARYQGTAVELQGEYRGRKANPLFPGVGQGPPRNRTDWVLRDAAGEIWCTGAGKADKDLALPPLSGLGRRIRVTGTVFLTSKAAPFLLVREVKPLSALEAIICSLDTDKLAYQPGEPVRMTLTVSNPQPDPAVFAFPSSKTYDFAVLDDQGKELWRWSRGRVFTLALQQMTLKPGETKTITETWDQQPNAPNVAVRRPARVKVVGELNEDVKGFPTMIKLEPGR